MKNDLKHLKTAEIKDKIIIMPTEDKMTDREDTMIRKKILTELLHKRNF